LCRGCLNKPNDTLRAERKEKKVERISVRILWVSSWRTYKTFLQIIQSTATLGEKNKGNAQRKPSGGTKGQSSAGLQLGI